jgi:hypothetical protein
MNWRPGQRWQVIDQICAAPECKTEQHTSVRRLPDCGKYITGHGWREGNLGDFDGDGDLDILNKPYTWEAPRVDPWLNNGTGVRNQSGRQGMAWHAANSSHRRQSD